jgi:hypothetical protein
MSEKVASFLLRQVNRLGRVRDAVYLDTNAWSKLAKQEISYQPLLGWVQARGYHIWMARFQMAELSRDTRLARPMAELLRYLPVVVLDRELNEFDGEPWYKVKVRLDEFIRLSSQELFDEFVQQMESGPITQTRNQLDLDARSFRGWLERSLAAIPESTPRDWSGFSQRLEAWIRQQCERNGVTVNEAALVNPECYVGLRLSYSILFLRYFINRQPWKPSDYIDYLHAADMAYAGVVVTERNLAECIRQAAKRREVTAPDLVSDLTWLHAPSDRESANTYEAPGRQGVDGP